MRNLVRAAAVLLAAGLVGLYVVLQETRFALAAAAILCLVEIALALRARGRSHPVEGDPSSLAASRVAYTEEDGVLTVTLSGAAQRASAPYVALSRRLPHAGPTSEARGPCLALSRLRGPLAGSIQDAHLSPQRLRLALDERGTQAVGAQTLCVTLPAGTDQRLLERALGRILHGVPFTSDRSMPDAGAQALHAR